MEPYRIRVIEPIRKTTRGQRDRILMNAAFNLYAIDAEHVLIDLLTDSGLCAMSANQVAAMMRGDESYAGSSSYRRFEAAVKETFGYAHVVPTHQGRAAERLMLESLARHGDIIPSNTHFETTRANCFDLGVEPVDLPTAKFWDFYERHPFKGDMDCEGLQRLLGGPEAQRVPFILLTITNNLCGDQPVSMGNIRKVAEIAERHGKPVYIDACRFAQNAWFIRTEEHGYEGKRIESIAREMFSYADGCVFSAKKDGLAHIGGFFATRSEDVANHARERLVLTDGFVTYGGMTGRDMETIAVGLSEVLEEDYLEYRMGATRYLLDALQQRSTPVLVPAGGHAVYIDAKRMLPHLSKDENPGQSLVAELYAEGGVRGTRIVLSATPTESSAAYADLVRLALPSRVYTTQHFDYVAAVVRRVADRASRVEGLRVVSSPRLLGGFLARYARTEGGGQICRHSVAEELGFEK